MFREIDDIVETLKNAKDRGRKCSVLIGAGCSVTAGIPTAQGFVDIIKEKYPRGYERANPKTYPNCMAQLSIDEQRSLIVEYVDKAKINWGHIALAQLIKAGYVDRVLTTNFDPLIMRACALVNEFPATYDLATSQHFEPDKVPEKAIFHLHGQRSGFILLNSQKALDEHSKKLAPIFDDAGRGRVWIVVGYSGESDPVFDHLANVDCFDNTLYWVGYKDSDPASHLKERLLIEEKYAFYTKGFDADSFFVTLAQMLNCFPPAFVSSPFSHLESLFDNFTPYTFPRTSAPVNAMYYARNFVHEAVEKIEVIQTDVLQAWSDLLGGQYEKVIELQSKYIDRMHPEINDAIVWAYISQGNILLENAESNPEKADELFKQAGEKYEAALNIKPDFYEALNNWGNSVSAWANTKSGTEADELFKQAGEKYEAALNIKPDEHEILNNWGFTISDWAKTKSDVEADELFKQAGEKYEAALNIKPDEHDALYDWGNSVSDWAKTKSGTEADELFEQAGEKYESALKIKPDFYDALNNWGDSVSAWANTKSGAEADKLFKQAGEKYEAALKIKPDEHETLNNWGNSVSAWANTKSSAEADKLFKQAGDNYEAALKIGPDEHETLNNWGNSVSDWAKTKSGAEADKLFKQAGDNYEVALKIKPDFYEALNNWGNSVSDWAKTKSGTEADELFKQAGKKYEAALEIKPDEHDTLNNWGAAVSDWAKTKSGAEADELFKQAGERYDAALKFEPDEHEALNNWGNSLSDWAKTKSGAEADKLFKQAGEKYEAALKIKPDKYEALNNWGTAVSDWAKTKSGTEADELFKQAGEKHEAALKIKPDEHETLNNWGNSVSDWAKTKSGAEADKLFKQAKDILLKGESVKNGYASYNLACVCSLSGSEEECRQWLINSKQFGDLPDKQYLEQDTDLDPVRDKDWFVEFMKEL